MKHCNIAVFVPHIGCSHRCSFCNQRHITGTLTAPTGEDVDRAVAVALSSRNYDKNSGQLAFFGGSFTAVNRSYMLSLLRAARRHIDEGSISGIRISTRPDAIDDEVLQLLREYGVRAIELGAQSMNDEVLCAAERGHTAADVQNACRLIREHGFELGLQMMTGLYRSNEQRDLDTALAIIALHPDTVRIYPTLVLENTRLCELYRAGEYQPQTVEQAATLGGRLLSMFYSEGIRVIRFGLHSVDMQHFVAGPWHPSLSELAQSKIYLNAALEQLHRPGSYTLYVRGREISKMVGNCRNNLEKLALLGYNCKVKCDDSVAMYQVMIREEQ